MFEQPDVRIGGRGKRWFGGAGSAVAIHLALISTAVLIAQTAPSRAPKFMKSALTYIALSAPPSVPSEPIPIEFPEMSRMAELSVSKPPEVVVPVETAGVQKQDPPYVPKQDPVYAPKAEPVRAPKQDPAALLKDAFASTPAVVAKPVPQVAVGAFAASDVPSRTMNANKQIDRAGFDAPVAQAPAVTRTTAAVGVFDTSSTAAKPGTDRPVGTLVADAGFGRTTVAAAQQRTTTVAETGFGGDEAAQGARLKPRPTGTPIQTAGFDAQPATPSASKSVAPAERIDIPMEVLSKPNPTYTAEARNLKLEGEVALEVQFCATGSVRVLRVVRGLGHGLDEAAATAAENIRFKPAQSRGQAVDFKTTVHIVFRLS